MRRVLFITFCALLLSFTGASLVHGQQTIRVDAQSLLQKATIFFSPRSGTFSEGTTFEVPLYVDTKGRSVNTFDLVIKYDPKKLAILQPSGSRSIIGIWVEPPSYSNTEGILKLTGVIPGGISTQSGLITTITFKAIGLGEARVSVSETSEVLANDGYGTRVEINYDVAQYSVMAKAPEGVRVFSETHPFQDAYYKNNNPIISWEKPLDVSGFSYEVDDKPFTVPDTTVDTEDTTISLPKVKEGLTYFHVRAVKKGVWGGTSHFLIRIDTQPPAKFTPKVEIYTEAFKKNNAMLSFFTTDSLSGVDHYEVAVIDKSDANDVSPLFVQTQSPYQLPTQSSGDIRAIVRVFDTAGNVRDESIDINLEPTLTKWFFDNLITIVLGLLLLFVIIEILVHYLFGHHILNRAVRTFKIVEMQEHEAETPRVLNAKPVEFIQKPAPPTSSPEQPRQDKL